MLIGYPKSLFSKVGTRVGGTISRAQMFHFVNTVLIGDWDGCAHLECCSNLSVMPFTVVGWFLDPVRLAINPVLLFCPCSRRRIVPPKVRATSHPVLNLAREALHELGGRVVAAPTAAKVFVSRSCRFGGSTVYPCGSSSPIFALGLAVQPLWGPVPSPPASPGSNSAALPLSRLSTSGLRAPCMVVSAPKPFTCSAHVLVCVRCLGVGGLCVGAGGTACLPEPAFSWPRAPSRPVSFYNFCLR